MRISLNIYRNIHRLYQYALKSIGLSRKSSHHQILGTMSSIENNMHEYVGECWGTQVRHAMLPFFKMFHLLQYVCVRGARCYYAILYAVYIYIYCYIFKKIYRTWPTSRNRTSMKQDPRRSIYRRTVWVPFHKLDTLDIHVAYRYCQGFLGMGFPIRSIRG